MVNLEWSLRIFSVFLGIGVQFSEGLDCAAIPATDQVAGKTLYLPGNVPNPVTLTANFNCTYLISPPKMVYAQIIVTNQLKGLNDVITVRDGQNSNTVIRKNDATSNIFYVFPQTVTTVTIDNQDPTSQFLLTVVYLTLPTATQNQLQKNQNLNYFTLTSLQLKPVTVVSDEPIILTLGRSGHIVDVFDNYFITDGPLDSFKSVHRLSEFTANNFNSTSNSLSIVGLGNDTSFSTVMVSPASSLQGFSKFAGVTVNPKTQRVSGKVSDGLKKGVMVLAPNSGQLVLTAMDVGTSSSCLAIATTGPPGYSQSKMLIDFVSDSFSLPQIFPFPYLSIIYQNCDIVFSFDTVTPSGYFKTDQEKSGYIFSPSFLNSASKADFNVTFEYTGSDKKQFVVDVVDVTVNNNAELDIDIYDADAKKTLSAVITGDQMGTRSKAFGQMLNVHMSGDGTAKLKWSLTSSSFSILGLPTILLLLVSFLI